MPAPFEHSDEPTYSWKYPDPQPYEYKDDTDYGTWVTVFILLSVLCIFFASMFFLSDARIQEFDQKLNTMGCNEFSLNYSYYINGDTRDLGAGFQGSLYNKYMVKCHPEIKNIPRTADNWRSYFKTLDCATLSDYVKFKDTSYRLAEIEYTVRCT